MKANCLIYWGQSWNKVSPSTQAIVKVWWNLICKIPLDKHQNKEKKMDVNYSI